MKFVKQYNYSVDKLYEEQISKSALKEYLETKKKDILAVGDEPRALRVEIAVLDEMIDDLLANNIK